MEEPTRSEAITQLNVPVLSEVVVEETPPVIKPTASNIEPLNTIKEDFARTINAMALQPSIFSKMASYWGSISFWPKLILGILLSVPIIIGFVLNSTVLIPLSISIFLLAMGCTFLLENHNQNTQSNTAQLKSGVNSLTGLFY